MDDTGRLDTDLQNMINAESSHQTLSSQYTTLATLFFPFTSTDTSWHEAFLHLLLRLSVHLSLRMAFFLQDLCVFLLSLPAPLRVDMGSQGFLLLLLRLRRLFLGAFVLQGRQGDWDAHFVRCNSNTA